MSLLLYKGSLLSPLSVDPTCCCDNPPGPEDSSCCCEGLLTTSIPTSLFLTLASTCGKLDGQVITLSLTTPQGSGCRTWTGKLTLACTSVVTLSFYLYCDFTPSPASNPCRNYRLRVQPNSSACIPSLFNTYNVDTDCSCDPLVLNFTNMVSPYDDPAKPGTPCDCCNAVDTFDATVTT